MKRAAFTEANKFLVKAGVCLNETGRGAKYVKPGKNCAALKRASMDLTKALTELRK